MNQDVSDSCKNCLKMRTEINDRARLEQSITASCATLKLKVLQTDTLIKEFTATKMDYEMQTRKVEEFTRLTDKLQKDLSHRNEEYSTMLTEIEPLKKTNLEYISKIKSLREEIEELKDKDKAAQSLADQLSEKIIQLESELRQQEGTNKQLKKESERLKIKLSHLNDQLKEAKDSSAKIKRQLGKLKKTNQKLTKNALNWGQLADSSGKMKAVQRRIYHELRDGTADDDDSDQSAPDDTEEQSKLLEMMLNDSDGEDGPEVDPSDGKEESPDTAADKVAGSNDEIRQSPSKCRDTVPAEVVQETISSPRRSSRTRKNTQSPAKTNANDSETILNSTSTLIVDPPAQESSKSDKNCDIPAVNKTSLPCVMDMFSEPPPGGGEETSPVTDTPSPVECNQDPPIIVEQIGSECAKEKIETVVDCKVVDKESSKDLGAIILPVEKSSVAETDPSEAVDVIQPNDLGKPDILEVVSPLAPQAIGNSEADPEVSNPEVAVSESTESKESEIAPVVVGRNADANLTENPVENVGKDPAIETNMIGPPITGQPLAADPTDNGKDISAKKLSTFSLFDLSPDSDDESSPPAISQKDREEHLQSNSPEEVSDQLVFGSETNECPSQKSDELVKSSSAKECPLGVVSREQKKVASSLFEIENVEIPNNVEEIQLIRPAAISAVNHPSLVNGEAHCKGPLTDGAKETQSLLVDRQKATWAKVSSKKCREKDAVVQKVPVSDSTFKVPRVPSLDPADFVGLLPTNARNRAKESCDEELSDILNDIRSRIIFVPRIHSPLPKSPVTTKSSLSRIAPAPPIAMQPAKEPKSKFPILPRCAFNWSAKKLPISDKLTEQFGAYLHPGLTVRVRFRCLGRLMNALYPDLYSGCRGGKPVTNFAEAERRPKIESPPPKPKTKANPPPKNNNALFGDSSDEEPEPEPEPELEPATKEPPPTPTQNLPKPKPNPRLKNAMPPLSPTPHTTPPLPAHVQQHLPIGPLVALGQPHSSTTQLEVPGGRPRSHLIPLSTSFRPALRPDRLTIKPVNPVLMTAKPPVRPTAVPVPESFTPLLSKTKTNPKVVVAKRASREDDPVPSISLAIPGPSSNVVDVVEIELPATPSKRRVAHAMKRPLEMDSSSPVKGSSIKKLRTPVQENPPLVPSFSCPQNNPLEAVAEPVPQPTPVAETHRPKSPEIPAGIRRLPSPEPVPLSPPLPISRTPPPPPVEEVRATTTGDDAEKDVQKQSETSTGGEENEMPLKEPENVATEKNQDDADVEDGECDDEEENRLPDGPATGDDNQVSPSPMESADDQPLSPPCLAPNDEETPHSPEDSTPKDSGNQSTVSIPSSPLKPERLSAYQLIKKLSIERPKPVKKMSNTLKKMKTNITSNINNYMRAETFTDELLTATAHRLFNPRTTANPSFFIRHLISFVIKHWEDVLDQSYTPPAPPLSDKQQRCIRLLKAFDEKNIEFMRFINPNYTEHMYTDLFLHEMNYIMFKANSQLTIEENCSIARIYTALCRSRGQLIRARIFLYDCFYFFPPQSYALTYTVLSVWAEVLRHVNFPTGLTAMDRTFVYLLFNCVKVKAVPGLVGKVLQVRSFVKTIYGYQTDPNGTAEELLVYLMSRLNEPQSADEAFSLCWNLKLLARWEGVDLGLNIIQKHLYPFLRRWSSGEGEDPAAAATIICIGLIGKTLPEGKQTAVTQILEVMKGLLGQADQVSSVIQEATAKTLILLGEKHDPKMVVELLKSWKPSSDLSPDLQTILKNFLANQEKTC